MKEDTIFDIIDSEPKAYWLGFLYADGWNQANRGAIGIHLSIKDRDHLVEFCNFMGLDPCKIKETQPKLGNIQGRVINNRGSCTAVVYGRNLSNNLVRLGMTQRKSLTLDFPTDIQVPDSLLRHFIRGYLDGDGCITRSTSKNVTRYRIIFIGTKNFCEGLIKTIPDNISMRLWTRRNATLFYCCISGNQQIKKYLEWLYEDATIFLDRKHSRYLELKQRTFKR